MKSRYRGPKRSSSGLIKKIFLLSFLAVIIFLSANYVSKDESQVVTTAIDNNSNS